MPADPKAILRLEVPLIVQLGERSMDIRDIVSLAPGAILELPKSAEDDLEVLVNNRQIGTGVAVKIGENFGIRITTLGDAVTRARAATGKP